jgi:drug/metabolite transporter (DMT)-like permease
MIVKLLAAISRSIIAGSTGFPQWISLGKMSLSTSVASVRSKSQELGPSPTRRDSPARHRESIAVVDLKIRLREPVATRRALIGLAGWLQMTRLRADTLLLFAAIVWGTAFIAQKNTHAAQWPALFTCIRFGISALLMVPLALRESSYASPEQRPSTYERTLAVMVGLALCVAGTVQQVAMTTSSATHGGFLTAIYLVLVPFVAWGLNGHPPRPIVLTACVVALAGAWLLAGGRGIDSFSGGDKLLLIADVFWAAQIALIGKFQSRINRPFLLCLVQFSVTAIGAGLVALLTEHPRWNDVKLAVPSLLYTGLVSGGLAYTAQIVAQRYTPPAEAALIMSLESVAATLSGIVLLGERLTTKAAMGCTLILCGAAMCEVIPILQRRSAPTAVLED